MPQDVHLEGGEDILPLYNARLWKGAQEIKNGGGQRAILRNIILTHDAINVLRKSHFVNGIELSVELNQCMYLCTRVS